MNILLTDHFGSWQRLGFYHEKYYAAQGHDVTMIPIGKTPQWTDVRKILPFFIPKGKPLTFADIESQAGKKFDFYFEFDEGGQFHLGGLKKTSAFKAFWSCDIYREDKQKFHKWFEEEFDVIFAAQKNFLHIFKKRPCHWLPYACDPAVHKKFDLPKIYDISFIGNVNPAVYPERVKLLEELGRHFNVQVFNGVYGDDVSKIYSQSKFVFNKSHSNELNMRVFDVMCAGACLITDRIENGLPDLFQDQKHLVMYDDLTELKDKVAYYIFHESERETIAQAGQKEVHEKHTFYHRAQTVLKISQEMMRQKVGRGMIPPPDFGLKGRPPVGSQVVG